MLKGKSDRLAKQMTISGKIAQSTVSHNTTLEIYIPQFKINIIVERITFL